MDLVLDDAELESGSLVNKVSKMMAKISQLKYAKGDSNGHAHVQEVEQHIDRHENHEVKPEVYN